MMRPSGSTTFRSAEPEPCAIQVPPMARMIGSTAVTRPLAGRTQRISSPSMLVDVGLAVGDHQQGIAAQPASGQVAHALGGPEVHWGRARERGRGRHEREITHQELLSPPRARR